MHDGAKKLLLEEVTPGWRQLPPHRKTRATPKRKRQARHCGASVCGAPPAGEYRADAVLVATGGVRYPTTGSTGDGYKLAQQAGHTLIEPVPSLVSLVSHDADCKKDDGLGAEKRHP